MKPKNTPLTTPHRHPPHLGAQRGNRHPGDTAAFRLATYAGEGLDRLRMQVVLPAVKAAFLGNAKNFNFAGNKPFQT